MGTTLDPHLKHTVIPLISLKLKKNHNNSHSKQMTCWYSGYNLGSDAQQSPVIFSPKHPGYFCGPHSLIFSRCLDSLPSVECPGHEANDSPRHRVPRLRMTAATPPFPLCTFRACKWALLLIVYVATFERVPHQLDWQFSIYQLLVDLLQ